MYCRKCGTQFDGNFCPNCGEPAKTVQETDKSFFTVPEHPKTDSMATKMPFYSQTWFIIVSMFTCCFPIGVFLMWKYKKFNKVVRIAITALFTFSLISVLANPPATSETSTGSTSSTGQETEAMEQTETPASTSHSPRDTFIEQLTANSDVTEEAAGSTYDILTADMGFENIECVDNPSGTLFEVKADNCNLKITVSDKLYMVICGGYNMYEEDTIKYTRQAIEDRSLNGKESYYYTIAQEIVSNNLKSPKTADFPSIIWSPSDIGMARNKDLVVVQSYVDAQNSFGALVRSKFTVQFRVIDLDSFSYETTYINIDGSESGEYINMD